MSEHKLFKVSQNAVIKNSKGQILILRQDGKWMLPGGRMEENEDWEEALRREVQEETGITDLKLDYVIQVNLNDSTSTYIATFACHSDNVATIKLSEENDAFAWINEADLDKYEFWHESIPERIKKALAGSPMHEIYEKKDAKRGVDYIGVNVVFVCHDEEGNILLHKRGPGCRDEVGTWDCGGGAVEFGESLEEAVRREVSEEYCVEPKKLELLGVRSAVREKDGRKTHWVPTVWYVLVDRHQVKNGEPHKLEELGWFKPGEMPEPLHSQFPYDLEMLKKYLAKFCD